MARLMEHDGPAVEVLKLALNSLHELIGISRPGGGIINVEGEMRPAADAGLRREANCRSDQAIRRPKQSGSKTRTRKRRGNGPVGAQDLQIKRRSVTQRPRVGMGMIDDRVAFPVYSPRDVRKSLDPLADETERRRDPLLLKHVKQRC